MLRTYGASPTQVSVDLSALAHNLQQLRACTAPSCTVIAIVKANAYGHGALEVCRALLKLGVTTLGVATVSEGVELREAGIISEVLVLGPTVPRELTELLEYRLVPLIYDESMVLALTERLSEVPASCPVHVEVETGMGRLGVAPERLLPLLRSAAFRGPLRLAGVMTHFADADNVDASYTEHQLRLFTRLLEQVRAAGIAVPLAHMANTAGILKHPASHLDAVRPGIGLYGYPTGAAVSERVTLRPVLSWSTHIVQIRALQPGHSVSYNQTFRASRISRIAVLPVGYADGYNRRLSNKGWVLVHGHRVPVVGRVCMDMTMVDVTDVPHVKTGDEVALIGSQADQRITADEVASWQGTISYEVLCAIGPRVHRVFSGAP